MAQSPIIFDRDLLRLRRLRAARQGAGHFLLDRVTEDFAERLAVVLRRFDRALDLGTPGDALCVALAASGKAGAIAAFALDEETLPFGPASLDLIVSGLALHSVNDLPGLLIQARRALRPDGLFLAAMLGGDTLTELRESFTIAESEIEGGVSPRVAPFADVRDVGALLQRAGFALPVADVDSVRVRYASPLMLIRDLRAMGMTSALAARRRSPLRRRTLARMIEVYAERFADADSKVRATFEIVWLSGWAPHESQQQPLKPGSARTRLADALGTPERPAGEKAGG